MFFIFGENFSNHESNDIPNTKSDNENNTFGILLYSKYGFDDDIPIFLT